MKLSFSTKEKTQTLCKGSTYSKEFLIEQNNYHTGQIKIIINKQITKSDIITLN